MVKFTKVSITIQKKLKNLLSKHASLLAIIQDIHEAGGASYLVGGAVRDLMLGLPVKDLDIEVHGLQLAQLEKILQKFGRVNYVGKAYGVLRLETLDIDWSIPRSDKAGRKPQVTLDPLMDIKKAFERRDVTMNAMGIDLITCELVDPFHGLQDLKKGILRATNKKTFGEDPLRFFRVMQFVGRFEMSPDHMLNALCKKMDISKVSRERIESEFKKLLLKSMHPSRALDWLDKIKRLTDVLPEVAALKGVKQNPKWHPEGDVYEHTKQAIDAAAELSYDSELEKLIIMYAALCHDLGKAKTTVIKDGAITSYRHEIAGVALAKKLLKRIMNTQVIIQSVAKLVRAHMYPLQLVAGNASSKAYKRLALTLSPQITLETLAKLVVADKRARNPKKNGPLKHALPEVDEFIRNAKKAHAYLGVEAKILQGKDLMPEIEPGPLMGTLVKEAYKIQLDENIHDKSVLKKRVLQCLKKEKK